MSRSLNLILLVALLLSGCAGTIDGATLAAWLATPDESLALIDVRSVGEYQEEHLPGAINIPVHALLFRMNEVAVRERSEPVVVYCAHGSRAGLAGFFLRLAGFSQILHLQGDIRAWRGAGHPLTTGPEPGLFAK